MKHRVASLRQQSFLFSSSAGCTHAVPCILIQARVVGGSTLVARVGQKSHFYHTQLVGRGLAAHSQKLHPCLGPYRPIRHHWIIMPLKASFPIFRFPFFLLHFSFPFFRFLFSVSLSFVSLFSVSLLSGSLKIHIYTFLFLVNRYIGLYKLSNVGLRK